MSAAASPPPHSSREQMLAAARRLHDDIRASLAAAASPATLADRLDRRDLRCAEASLRIAIDYLAHAAGVPDFRIVA